MQPGAAGRRALQDNSGAVAIGVTQMVGDARIKREGKAERFDAPFGVKIPRPRQRQIGGAATALWLLWITRMGDGLPSTRSAALQMAAPVW